MSHCQTVTLNVKRVFQATTTRFYETISNMEPLKKFIKTSHFLEFQLSPPKKITYLLFRGNFWNLPLASQEQLVSVSGIPSTEQGSLGNPAKSTDHGPPAPLGCPRKLGSKVRISGL